jgi:V/A-type H+/Na+-transporting ATPase subunit I
MLRPAAARWFEVLCARGESVRLLAELARTGAVEVEVRPGVPEDLPVAELAAGLQRYADLARRYARYWSRGRGQRSPLVPAPAVALATALERIEAWRAEADPLIAQIQRDEDARSELWHLQRILHDMQSSPIDFDLLVGAGPLLGSFCGFTALEANLRLPEDCLFRTLPWEDERCILVVGPAARMAEAREGVTAVKGRVIERPAWLKGSATQALAGVEGHLAELQRVLGEGYARLDALFERYQLGQALAEVAPLHWFQVNVGALERASEHFVWITGWTDPGASGPLVDALERGGAGALLRFAAAPEGLRAPQVLVNPPWLRPFEVFARALGVPAHDEADPTPLLAAVVPLLFGYMFGDLGQGLLLLGVGLGLRSRFAFAPLLIFGGVSASLFGLLFGSLFGLEHLLPALWLRPLEDPVGVLVVPLGFAVALLSLGQLLRGLGAWWGGRWADWLATEAGFLVLYLGAVGAWWDSGLLWLALLGALWCLAGAYWLHRRATGVLAAAAHLAEGGLQILVNTLSFARVGAFALAHAALCSAFVALAEVVGSGAGGALVLVLGNLLVIGLEGLVVSIQTTRLVLFEFFVRFLEGKGRVFRPLAVPPEEVGLQPGPARGGV